MLSIDEYKVHYKDLFFTSNAAPCSKKCLLELHNPNTISRLNELFTILNKHPYLHTISGIKYDASTGQVSVIQPFMELGSLRDILFRTDPTKDWSEKYQQQQHFSPCTTEVVMCCKDILEAALFLYEVGFPPLGHIHSGNIFVTNKGFLLGGYENTLLGYRTRLYKEIEKEGLLNMIDVIMFGHVVYDLVTPGNVLSGIIPDEEEFAKVNDEKIKVFLRDIFNQKKWNGNHKKMFLKIKDHPFLKDYDSDVKCGFTIPPEVKQLLADVRNERHAALDLDFMEATKSLSKSYPNRQPLERLGWRTEKVWGKVTSSQHGDGILTTCPVPNTCPIFIKRNMTAIKELLTLKHPYLQYFHDVHHVKIGTQHMLVVFQLHNVKGSIRDLIFNSAPLRQWSEKYKGKGKMFDEKEIAKYGYQILKALLFLRDLGFPPMTHLHTGNIFIHDSRNYCMLGGYEGMLLGYQPHHHHIFRQHLNTWNIDIIMFGHVIFEMSSGRELKTLAPEGRDYEDISGQNMRNLLKYIFKEVDGDFVTSLEDVINYGFFKSNGDTEIHSDILTKEAADLLQKVHKGKPRDQNNFIRNS